MYLPPAPSRTVYPPVSPSHPDHPSEPLMKISTRRRQSRSPQLRLRNQARRAWCTGDLEPIPPAIARTMIVPPGGPGPEARLAVLHEPGCARRSGSACDCAATLVAQDVNDRLFVLVPSGEV